MRILITGAAGLVGSALAEAYASEEVLALRHADLDICDAEAVRNVVGRFRPEIVFNCAVIGVDSCEADPALAEQVNVHGPRQLAASADAAGAAMVHFSSNYVFDGARTDKRPYTFHDEPRPIQVYGRTKLEGELAVAAAAARAFIVRTSWVFGPGKDSFLSTAGARLARGERVRAITDTFASITFVADLASRVREVVALGHSGTYHIVNGGVCSYETFARESARLVGLGEQATNALIERTTEAGMARPASRPRWTPMRCLLSEQLKLPAMRSWQDALASHLSR